MWADMNQFRIVVNCVLSAVAVYVPVSAAENLVGSGGFDVPNGPVGWKITEWADNPDVGMIGTANQSA